MEMGLASASLVLAFCAFVISIYFWKKQFRPILSAMVKTHAAGNEAILYDLEIINCGSLPAKNISLSIGDADTIQALGDDASDENKQRWLACFEETIPILHNNSSCKCSFGMTGKKNFWKYRSKLPITIKYESFWWKKRYEETVVVHIIDSESFTGYSWE
ncbi:MAG TPA: hypothetical protein DHV36_22205 [Desulfobacteraceae bacterium]|nr:hypothetical protein [Desulfobacteraceae bacterium]|tara:strand:- start:1080 stop:1559 length:480 start_codon:yes stop_codon:yes gene_type:complete